MILLCAGQRSTKAFEALSLFSAQLDRQGHRVAIDERFLPDGPQKYQKYEAAPYLANSDDLAPDVILVLEAEAISDEAQFLLRSMPSSSETTIWGLGRFATHQDEISARSRLSFAFARDVQILDISGPDESPLFDRGSTPLAAKILPSPVQRDEEPAGLIVYLPVEQLEDAATLSDMAALHHRAALDLHVVTTGQGKELIRQSRYADLSVFGYSELPPSILLAYCDVIAFFGANIPGERMALFALKAMGAGKVVIDCTQSADFMASGAPTLKGPVDTRALGEYLDSIILPNKHEIGRRIQQSDWLKTFDLTRLETKLQLQPPSKSETDHAQRTVFFPTNGNGLGHAQRCALIAKAMPTEQSVCFTAFPSCVDMLQNRGFACAPMVQRSEMHPEEYDHDLINYLRLRQVVRSKDQLVFDGGYVFDSVYRTISETQCASVWIRRGLWQSGQINQTALEREHVFSKVIVPQEVFGELNNDYSFGERVHHVGPIVDGTQHTTKEAQKLRKTLSAQFDQEVDTLVVSMLGGGVASERTVQLQMLCSTLEPRKNCLHLVVAWPNAIVSSGVYGWKNSHVIQTQNTQALCQAADLVVSAAGYNSFHELVYTKVPSILIPQSAPYLDDQERRARAAADRGAAVLILEHELLQLGREVDAFLDEGKADLVRAALNVLDLPEAGNAAAAALIAEGVGP